MADEVLELWGQKFKIPSLQAYICLTAPGKCACNAINAFHTQPRYRHTFSVYQRGAYNEYLLYIEFQSLMNVNEGDIVDFYVDANCC